MTSFIPTGRPLIDEEDIAAVSSSLRSGWLSSGPKVSEFEEAFSTYVKSKYAIAVSSGTAALELAMASLDIEEGEIITTPLSFAATANSILYNNLVPVFVDIDVHTLNIDPEAVRRAITPRTRAIIYVDFAGQPCDIDSLQQIASEHNLRLIEDAAHAVGAEYKGKKLGGFADVTTFSFHPLKNMTTGEGGMITTNNEDLYKKIILLRNHGLDKSNGRFGGSWSMDLPILGRNFRLTDFQCALGISQLQKLDKFNERRKHIALMYTSAFTSIPEITLPIVQSDVLHAWHLFVILLNKIDRNVLYEKLKERGVHANVHYIPIYKLTHYQNIGYTSNRLINTENIFARLITLPLYPGMSDEEVQYVIRSVSESLQEINEGK